MQSHHTLRKIPFLQRIIAFAMKSPYRQQFLVQSDKVPKIVTNLQLQKILLPYIHISNEFREVIFETKYSLHIIFPLLLKNNHSRSEMLGYLNDLVFKKYIPYSQIPDKFLQSAFIGWFIDEVYYHGLIKIVGLSPLVVLTKKRPGREVSLLESLLGSVNVFLLKSFLSRSDKDLITFHFVYEEMLLKVLVSRSIEYHGIEKHPDFPEMLDLIFSYIILAFRRMAEKHFKWLRASGKLREDQDENDLTKMKIQEKEDLFKTVENFLENRVWSPKVYNVFLKNAEILFNEEQIKKLKDIGVKRPDGFFSTTK